MAEVPVLDIRTAKDFKTFMKAAPESHYEMEMKMAIIECLIGVITAKIVSKGIPVSIEFSMRLWEISIIINRKGYTPHQVRDVILASGEGFFVMTDENDKPFVRVRHHLTNQIRSGDIQVCNRYDHGWLGK